MLWQSLWSCWPCWPVHRLVSIRRRRLITDNGSAAITVLSGQQLAMEPARQRQGQLDTQPVTALSVGRTAWRDQQQLLVYITSLFRAAVELLMQARHSRPTCDPNNSNI